jgi:anti-sigma factor RsiW
MATEPTQDQLSAYVDNELDGSERSQLDAHLATCSTCRSRLDALRQTVSALRALPMETPPRAFAVPAQRRQSLRWAPIGWAGSAVAAVLVVAFGISQLHPGVSGASTASSSNYSPVRGAVAPMTKAPNGAFAPDHAASVAGRAVLAGQQVTVTAPGTPSRSLTVSTDARTYPANGVLTVRVNQQGLTGAEASTVRLLLTRDGYAVRLEAPTNQAGFPMAFDASYSITGMPLPTPRDGSYVLQVTVDLANGSSLVAQLSIAITP